MRSYWIDNGSRSVCVFVQGDSIWARVFVNNRETATLQSWKGKTEAGAKKWAAKVLAN